MPTLKISKINSEELKIFIKKLLSIDKFVFMKITKDFVTSAVFLPQRDSVKLLNVPLVKVFTMDKPIVDPIKVTFYNANKIVDALSYFNGDIEGKLVYTETDDGPVASDFIISDKKLTIKLLCADKELAFMDMTKEDLAKVFTYKDHLWNFQIDGTNLKELKDYHDLDKDRDKFKLKVKDEKLFIVGENYEAEWVDEMKKADDTVKEVTVYKKYLPIIDKEKYDVFVCQNKIVFTSLDTKSLICIALCQTAEDEEDSDINKAIDELDDIPF
jgi:hypothetical protein